MQNRTAWIIARARTAVAACFLLLASAACGSGTSDTAPVSAALPPAGLTGASWWNIEEQYTGQPAYRPAGIGPVYFGASTWVGAVELAPEGETRYVPNSLDPDRSESICTHLDPTLIECRTDQYDRGNLSERWFTRATPGAPAPRGTLRADDFFFPGGIDSADAYAEVQAGGGYDVTIQTFVRPVVGGVTLDGFEARLVGFRIPDLVIAKNYEVSEGMFGQGARFRSPRQGATTQVLEIATSGTLHFTAIGAAPGERIAGWFVLVFPNGAVKGSFDVPIVGTDGQE